jgi:hypothetical protein
MYDPGDGAVVGRKDGREVVTKSINHSSELEDLVGKEVAQRLVDSPKNAHGIHKLSGLDLEVGGDGMKVFYDKIVPNTTNALLKKLGGGKVESVVLPKKSEMPDDVSVRDVAGQGIALFNQRTKRFYNGEGWTAEYLEDAKKFGSREQAKSAILEMSPKESNTQPGFQITPAMREKVGQGLPLFSLRDQNALASAKEEAKPRKYEGKKVVVPVKIEDTGEIASLTMDVNRTLDDYDERTANLQELFECL